MGIGRPEQVPFIPKQYQHPDVDDKSISDAEFFRRERAARDFKRRVLAVDPDAFKVTPAKMQERREWQAADSEYERSSQEPLSEFLAGLLKKEDPEGYIRDGVGEDFLIVNEQTTVAELKSLVDQRLLMLEEQEEAFRLEGWKKCSEEQKEKDREFDRILDRMLRATRKAQNLLDIVPDDGDTIVDLKKRLDATIKLRKDIEERKKEKS